MWTIQDEYSILNSKHFIGIHGYVLVYSVQTATSFEMVQVIRDKILNHLVGHLKLKRHSGILTKVRAPSGYQLSLLVTRVIYDQINDKSLWSRVRSWRRSSSVLTLRLQHGSTRTLVRSLNR